VPTAAPEKLAKGLTVASATPRKPVKVNPEGIVVAIVAVTGVVDGVDDLIVPGAFTTTLAIRNPKVVDDHEWGNKVGRVLRIAEWLPGDSRLPKRTKEGRPWPKDAGALVATLQYNLRSPRGAESYEWVRFYAESNEAEFSIGYRVPPTHARKRHDGVRVILQVDLFEVSHVLFGAASLSMALDVKSVLGQKPAAGAPKELTGEVSDEPAWYSTSAADKAGAETPSPLDEPWDEDDEKPRAPIEAKTAAAVVLETKSGGWDRNKGNAENLRKWFVAGADGAIPWGSDGDFDACVAIASKHMTPEQAKGYCNLRHHDALGIYPATHAKLEGKSMETKVLSKMRGSYQERIAVLDEAASDLLATALNLDPSGDGWCTSNVATYETEVVVKVWIRNEERAFLIPYTVTDDGVDLAEPQEVALSLVAEPVEGNDTPADLDEAQMEDLLVVEPLAASIASNDRMLDVMQTKTAQKVRDRAAQLALERKSAPTPEEAAEADYSVDNLPDDGWATYRKAEPIEALHIDHPFTVATREGVVSIDDETGGWLATDSDGYPYPIADAEFENVYVADDDTAAEPTDEPVTEPVAEPTDDGGDDPANYDEHPDAGDDSEGNEPAEPAGDEGGDDDEMVSIDPDEHLKMLAELED
jgi:hypothetical protein